MAREAYYEQKLRRGMEDIVCPRCGSRLTIKERWDKCICGYCGASLTRLSGKRFDYTDHSLTQLLVALICAGLMIPLTLVMMINWPTIMMSKSDEIFNVAISDDESGAVDPFQEVTVTFSGYDGSAVAKVDNGLDGVDYKIETNANLRNGDVAVVRASSKQYTLLRSVREYPVMGLSVLVKDPNKLSTDLVKMIEKESSAVVTKHTLTGGDTAVKKDEINKVTHHSIYVYPEDKNNTVFDIYSAVWHTTNDVDTPIYFVIKYKDLATSTDANGTHFTYDTTTLCGTYSSPTRVGVPASDVAENHYMTGYFSLQEINEDLLDRQAGKENVKIREFGS